MPAGTGPYLIEAGTPGDTYFDESTGQSAIVPAGTPALRALIPSVSASAVGVTALTEFAVGQIVAGSGISAATAASVTATNAAIGAQFGVADPTAAPSVIGAGTTGTKIAGGTSADDYALKLAGLAKLAKTGHTALDAIQAMRDDMADGVIDGRVNGATPSVNVLNITIPASGMTLTQLNSAIASGLAAATTQYAATNANIPTVTLSVSALKELVAAAIKVGEAYAAAAGTTSTLSTAAQNAQMAQTLQAQVTSLSNTAAQNGGTATAINNATATVVASTKVAAALVASANSANVANWFAGFKAGAYNMSANTNGSAVYYAAWINKEVMSGTLANLTDLSTDYSWSTGNSSWTVTSAGAGYEMTSSSSGWVADTVTTNAYQTIVNATDNGDGSISFTVPSIGYSGSFIPAVIDLAGKPLRVCAPNCGGATYPAGSVEYGWGNPVRNVDLYWLSLSAVGTNAAGVALTTLPVLGTDFCINSKLYHAIPNAAAGADNYQALAAAACTTSNIAAAIASSSVTANMRIIIQPTGVAAVPTVLRVMSSTNPAGSMWTFNGNIFGVANGQLLQGYMDPKGPYRPRTNIWFSMNKIAADAEAVAVGLPAVP